MIFIWLIYTQTIDTGGGELLFWFIATLPFLWSLGALIYGCKADIDAQ